MSKKIKFHVYFSKFVFGFVLFFTNICKSISSGSLNEICKKKIAITEFVLPGSLLIVVVTETHEAGMILRHEFSQPFRALLANHVSERRVSFLTETLCLRVIQVLG